MNERAQKALSDMDRAIQMLEHLTTPEPEPRRVEVPQPKLVQVVTLER